MSCKLAEPAKLQTVLLPKPPGIHDELFNKQQESANQPCCASINQHSGAALLSSQQHAADRSRKTYTL